MLAVVAHDLRQPASAALMAAEFVEELLDARSSGDTVRLQLALIRRCMRDALRLTEDLLTIGQLEGGALRLRCAPMECGTLLRETAAVIAGAARVKHVEVCVDATAERLHVLADRQRLRQVLANLCDNAVKVTPPGGRVTLSVRAESPGVRFAVTDSGPGIPELALPRVFDEYWQAEKGNTGRTSGSVGLGLSIARWLVQLHGGSIRAYNAARGGLTVAFSIPGAAGGGRAHETLARDST